MWSCPINFKDDVNFDGKGVEPSTIANELISEITSVTKDCNWHYYLPVKEIDGVDVEVKFVGNEIGLSLYIQSQAWIYGRKRLITVETAMIKHYILFKKTYIKKSKGECEIYNLSDFIHALKQIESDITIMKFNKLEGVLYTPDNLHPKDHDNVFNHFDEKSHEIMTGGDEEVGEECCVCLDTTKTTTLCGHKLCVMCWGKIKKNGRNVPCPICRKNLTNREEIDHLYPNGMATGPDADSEEIDWRDPYEDSEEIDWNDDSDYDEVGVEDVRNIVSLYGFGYEDPHEDIQEFPNFI